MTIAVPLVLIGWPLAMMAVFALIPARRAILVAVIAGWLLLPDVGYRFYGLPDYRKTTAVALAALLGVLIFDSQGLRRWRPHWVDLPLLGWCLVPIATSLTNGFGLYNGFSLALSTSITWGIVFVLARVYFSDREGLRELAAAILIGAVVYAPLCWLEMRLSPQLHRWVYGFYPHSFRQHMRYGGYRPMVFLGAGLSVSLFMATGTVLAFWFRDSRFHPRISMFGVSVVLGITTVLCKSFNGIFIMLIGVLMWYAIKFVPTRWWLLGLVALPPVYMSMRASGNLPAPILVDLITPIDATRAGSLGARLKQEDLFAAHTWSRPFFGWGPWKLRNFPFDEAGHQMTRGVDAFWVIALSKHGLVGLSMATMLLLIAPTLFALRVDPRRWLQADMIPASALAVILCLYAIDNLFNGMFNPAYLLAMGGLATFAYRWSPAANGRARNSGPAASSSAYTRTPGRTLRALGHA